MMMKSYLPWGLSNFIRKQYMYGKWWIKSNIFICSTELRELESQLKAAYMNKERAAQLAEKESLKYDQNVCTCW